MCDKSIDTCSFVFDSVPHGYKTQEMCKEVVYNDPFMQKYFSNRYKTQEICDKAVDDFLSALEFVIDWFVTNKMIKNLDNALFANDDIIFLKENSNNVTVFGHKMDILSVDLNNSNLDGVNFDEDDSETIIHVRFIAWKDRFKQPKPFIKDINKELMPVTWQLMFLYLHTKIC